MKSFTDHSVSKILGLSQDGDMFTKKKDVDDVIALRLDYSLETLTKHPDPTQIEVIADKLNISPSKVKAWFRKQREQLKKSPDTKTTRKLKDRKQEKHELLPSASSGSTESSVSPTLTGSSVSSAPQGSSDHPYFGQIAKMIKQNNDTSSTSGESKATSPVNRGITSPANYAAQSWAMAQYMDLIQSYYKMQNAETMYAEYYRYYQHHLQQQQKQQMAPSSLPCLARQPLSTLATSNERQPEPITKKRKSSVTSPSKQQRTTQQSRTELKGLQRLISESNRCVPT